MNITNAYARAIFRVKIGGVFPAGYLWQVVTNCNRLPTADTVFAFTAAGRLCALCGTRKAAAKVRAA